MGVLYLGAERWLGLRRWNDLVKLRNKLVFHPPQNTPSSSSSLFPEPLTETKCLRATDFLLHILDDDRDDDQATEDISAIMNSMLEEIGILYVERPDLGYLLEASDDELSLPPVADIVGSPSQGGVTGEVAQVSDDNRPEAAEFGQIWGFDDEFSGMGSAFDMGFGFVPKTGARFDGGVFGYSEELFEWTDLAELWQMETMPAITYDY